MTALPQFLREVEHDSASCSACLQQKRYSKGFFVQFVRPTKSPDNVGEKLPSLGIKNDD